MGGITRASLDAQSSAADRAGAVSSVSIANENREVSPTER